MADENILKEFLVSLGFKVDPASENRFKDSVKSATDSMKEFSVAVAAAATETLIGLNRMANNLGALHFQSQRVGASANSIKAFQLAIQQAGGTAEGASSALETLATKFRESPGWEQKLNGMGIATRDATGKARDNAEVLLDLGQKLAKMNNSQAMAEGRALGIDEKTILALRDPATIKAYQDQIDLQKQLGINLDDSSAKATAFSQEMNKLKATFDAFTSSAVGDLSEQLLPALQATNEGLREFADWFHALPPESQQAIKTIAEIGAGLALIVTNLKLIAAAKGVLGALGGGAAGGAGAGAAGGAAASGGSRIMGALSKWLGAAGLMVYSEDLNQGENEFAQNNLKKYGKALPPGVVVNGDGTVTMPTSKPAPVKQANPAAPATSGKQPRGIRNNNPGNLNYAGQRGATKETGPGGRFAVFQDAQSGLDALARQLQLYAKRGLNSVEKIIAQFAPPSENNTKAYVSSVSKSLGVSSDSALNMSNPALVRRMMDAIIRVENKNLNPYGSDMMSKAADKSVSISQTTHVTVHGAGSPAETANAVAGAQNDVNANLVRNSLPVVR